MRCDALTQTHPTYNSNTIQHSDCIHAYTHTQSDRHTRTDRHAPTDTHADTHTHGFTLVSIYKPCLSVDELATSQPLLACTNTAYSACRHHVPDTKNTHMRTFSHASSQTRTTCSHPQIHLRSLIKWSILYICTQSQLYKYIMYLRIYRRIRTHTQRYRHTHAGTCTQATGNTLGSTNPA
eukprot:GHVQ01024587.1.p1 GENE.GHVQ01024587.1~~GHVQ01024587.1.p1  ORF type:complete len:180 (+),score=17.82 GHVQ01024587.1:423-962(+)